MKKIFSFTFLLLVTLFALNTKVFAADTAMMPSQDATPSPIMMTQVNYQLPYPGLLPDSPLYKLKVLRDKITSLFITDPVKEVQFDLLQVNKQMAMVPLLLKKGEVSLADTTALKAEDYYTQITYVYKANNLKPDAKMYKTLQNAALKHQEVLTDAIKTVGKDKSTTFEQVINFSKTNWTEMQRIFTNTVQ